MSEFENPFNRPPYPNTLTVGFGEEHTVSYMEIRNNGTVDFFDDPLGPAVLTLTPDDLEIVQFLAAHLEHYQEQWEAGGRAESQKGGPNQARGENPYDIHAVQEFDWHEDETTREFIRQEIERRKGTDCPVTCDGTGPYSECPDAGRGIGPACVWPAHRAKGALPAGMNPEQFRELVARQSQKKAPKVITGGQGDGAQLLIDGVQVVRRAGGDR